jgi:hypothetical protein
VQMVLDDVFAANGFVAWRREVVGYEEEHKGQGEGSRGSWAKSKS